MNGIHLIKVLNTRWFSIVTLLHERGWYKFLKLYHNKTISSQTHSKTSTFWKFVVKMNPFFLVASSSIKRITTAGLTWTDRTRKVSKPNCVPVEECYYCSQCLSHMNIYHFGGICHMAQHEKLAAHSSIERRVYCSKGYVATVIRTNRETIRASDQIWAETIAMLRGWER